jgi:hypothetical protein
MQRETFEVILHNVLKDMAAQGKQRQTRAASVAGNITDTEPPRKSLQGDRPFGKEDEQAGKVVAGLVCRRRGKLIVAPSPAFVPPCF